MKTEELKKKLNHDLEKEASFYERSLRRYQKIGNDISKKEEYLNEIYLEKQKNFQNSLNNLKEKNLKALNQRSLELKKKLESKLDEKNKILENYEAKRLPYEKSLKNLKEENSKILEIRRKEIQKNYETLKKPYLQNLENLKSLNKKTLDLKKEKLLKKKNNLREQYVKNLLENSENPPQDYPKELVLYWKHKEWEAISKMLNALKQDIKGHESFLKRELGKHGKSIEWFMDKFEDEQNK